MDALDSHHIFSFSFSFSPRTEEISKLRGHTATLECPIDVKSCGNLHSLKWFKGDDRVALVTASGTSVEGPYSGR